MFLSFCHPTGRGVRPHATAEPPSGSAPRARPGPGSRRAGFLILGAALLLAPPLVGEVVLTEFAASAPYRITDEDGDSEDWIELYNTGPAAADLSGWSLTDTASRLTKWQFPAVTLGPGGFLIVFASEKDRRQVDRPLHANFKLGAGGEYLALVKPDGRTVATEYAPAFPPQAAGISYGTPLTSEQIPLVPRATAGRLLVPRDGTLDTAWLAPEFDDTGWTPATNSLGFTAGTDTVLVPVADSVADWSPVGAQEYRGWSYGYYDRSKDVVPGFQPGDFKVFPRTDAAYGPANFWNGSAYRWPAATTPWDLIGRTEAQPNGPTSGGEHWVFRRWTSPVAGDLQVRWWMAKAASGGSGVTGRLFHNGIQRDVQTIAGDRMTEVARTAEVRAVAVGDAIGLAVTPVGIGGATDDRSDATHLALTVLAPGTLNQLIATDVGAAMRGINASVYLRLPFGVANTTELTRLTLRLQYADGFVAWLNGAEVARRNAPGGTIDPDPAKALTWQSTATASRTAAEAAEAQEFDLTAYRDFLRPGTNVLCVQGLNLTAADPEFLLAPELTATRVSLDVGQHGYFATPTPGAVNGPASRVLGPIVSEVTHTRAEPADNDPLVVEARVTATLRAVGSVTLRWRVMYQAEASLPMRDDGTLGDRQAGDGRYTAIIPAAASRAGEMVRYAVVAADAEGYETRLPDFLDPRNSPQYFGTVVANPALVDSRLPVLHWFIQQPGAADSDTPARCSLYFAGRFYDNTAATVHGQSTRSFPKKSYDFDLNPGDKLRWSPDAPGVDDFNLLTTWADKTHLRSVLAYETYRDAGAPGHFAFPVRVQQNGAFFSVANFVENGDDNFLERLGLDPNGALYKMYNSAESAAGSEKKTRKFEGTADLEALIAGMRTADPAARQAFMFDHLDLPGMVNFLAARSLTADVDCCHKNYYLYRDTPGTGEWQAMPWDVDLSFGRVWTCGSPCLAYYDENIYTDQSIYGGAGNTVFTPLFSTAATKQMFLRRVRTLMDQLLQPPGTPPDQDHYRLRALALRDQIAPDAARDLVKWGTWGRRETITQAVDRLTDAFLPGRREYLFRTLSITNRGEIPAAQPAGATLTFGALEFRPTSGVPEQEWLSLRNDNSYAVDVSGWRLEGGARFTFKGGTVLPARSDLYVSPDVKAFRTRTTSPKGGERRFVVGPYSGNLSAWGETLQLLDLAGRVVASKTFTGDPSPAQRYLRITELMYHPAPAPGGSPDAQEFEYIELMNTGPVALDLRGVAFTVGIQFEFSSGAVTNLAPGARVLIVKNPAAFAQRYGDRLPVAGQYHGSLDNQGEQLRLEDAFGEKLLEFAYSDAWDRITDGAGFSLAVVDERAPWEAWGDPTQWRPDGAPGGSPGAANPPVPAAIPIVISEVLAHTGAPHLDAVELHNPTALAADLSGWFLTDDLEAPRKFRIPASTVIPPGGHAVFTGAEFSAAGAPNGFGLSSAGDEIWLLSGDVHTNLTGYLQGFEFGATESDVSLGPWVNSAGELDHVPLSRPTLGQSNAPPRVGPVVLAELMYHPADEATTAVPLAYVELANLTAASVPLYHPARPTNTWRLRDAIDFDLPPDVVLPPNGRLLVVGFDPAVSGSVLAAFRQHYELAGDVPVLGPWQGRLGNADETIELQKPDLDADGSVAYVRVEHVHYLDHAPWPAEADGTGASLQRAWLDGYANEPTHWFASIPTPGAPSAPTVGHVALDVLSNDHYRVRFVGEPGQSWQLQRSVDLTRWEDLGTAQAPPDGMSEYEDRQPLAGGAFYRAVRR